MLLALGNSRSPFPKGTSHRGSLRLGTKLSGRRRLQQRPLESLAAGCSSATAHALDSHGVFSNKASVYTKPLDDARSINASECLQVVDDRKTLKGALRGAPLSGHHGVLTSRGDQWKHEARDRGGGDRGAAKDLQRVPLKSQDS